MKQFIQDMIHMTEGEKLIHYWWLWLLIFVSAMIIMKFDIRRQRRKHSESIERLKNPRNRNRF